MKVIKRKYPMNEAVLRLDVVTARRLGGRCDFMNSRTITE